ncbi:UNVERIFIED_CONTAM: hypothetical protein K2H54_032531 [Gekko kuhli]
MSPVVARTLLAVALALVSLDSLRAEASGRAPPAARAAEQRFAQDVLTVFGDNRTLSSGQVNRMLQQLGAAHRVEDSLPREPELHFNQDVCLDF